MKRRSQRNASWENFHGFALAVRCEDDKAAWRSEESWESSAEDFLQASLCCFPITFIVRTRGRRASLSDKCAFEHFHWKSTYFFYACGDFQHWIFENANLASLKENVGFSIKQKSPSHFLSGMETTKHHDEAENPERAKRRLRKDRKTKNFQSFAPALQHEDDKAAKRGTRKMASRKNFKRFHFCCSSWRWRIEEVGGEQNEKFFRALLLLPNTKMMKRQSKKFGRWRAKKISRLHSCCPAQRRRSEKLGGRQDEKFFLEAMVDDFLFYRKRHFIQLKPAFFFIKESTSLD